MQQLETLVATLTYRMIFFGELSQKCLAKPKRGLASCALASLFQRPRIFQTSSLHKQESYGSKFWYTELVVVLISRLSILKDKIFDEFDAKNLGFVLEVG